MLCVYKLRTVSQAPGDHLQSPLPHSLIFLHFLLWLSLGNRLVTEQRAKEQLQNIDVASELRAKHRGRTVISNKEWCCVILHKHIISICISFSNCFIFISHKKDTLVLNTCTLKIYIAIIWRVYEIPMFSHIPFLSIWIFLNSELNFCNQTHVIH